MDLSPKIEAYKKLVDMADEKVEKLLETGNVTDRKIAVVRALAEGADAIDELSGCWMPEDRPWAVCPRHVDRLARVNRWLSQF